VTTVWPRFTGPVPARRAAASACTTACMRRPGTSRRPRGVDRALAEPMPHDNLGAHRGGSGAQQRIQPFNLVVSVPVALFGVAVCSAHRVVHIEPVTASR
jgi:hypothetical protein